MAISGKTTLILHAHPSPHSFTACWADASAAAAESLGDNVLRSDLCGEGFDPTEDPAHYADPPHPFDVLKAQEQASARNTLPQDVETEIAKLEAADRLILHFPLWWFAPPSILKGWMERVLAHGRTHDVDNRFDTGRFRGRKVLFCVTTGARAAESGSDGKEGDTRLHLWPAAYTFRYLGFDVLEPVLVHGVHGYNRGNRKAAMEACLARVLADQRDLIARFDDLPLIRFNPDSDFDSQGRLRSDAPSHSPFIRGT